MGTLRSTLALLAAMAAVSAMADTGLERGRLLSAPDCAGARNIVAEGAAVPTNQTYIRVQYLGDPGTPERTGEVANAVTWDVGLLTGLHAGPESQRGYRDEALPVGTSAFQLACGSAGFLINSWQFSHRVAIAGAGSSASIARDLDPPQPFGAGIVISADLALPWLLSSRPPVDDGTAQVSFMYYLGDRRSGVHIAHVIALFDSRPAGLGGSGVEASGFDQEVPFVASPLSDVDGTGNPVRFVSPPVGPGMRYVSPWSDPVGFRAVVTWRNLAEALATLRRSDPRLSPDPADYDVLMFGVLAEIFPGTGDQHNVSFAGNVQGLALRSFASAFSRTRP